MRFIISTENDYFDIDKYIGKTLNITSWKKWKDIPNLEVKELYFNIPINKSMAMVQNCPKSYLITFFSSSAVREFTRLIHIKNVFVTKEGIYKDSSEIKLPNSKIKFRSKKILFNGTIYDKLIYGVNTWGAWGHFLNGSPLSGLLYFPEEIVRQSMFYWQVQDMRFAHDVYEFGFQIAGIAVIDSTAVFVRDLYISAPIDIVNGQNHFTRMLREKVYKFYKLENVIPKYGLITNRRPGSNRCVRNMDEFIKEIKAKYPHIEWLYRNDSQLIDTPRAVKDLANTKYFICPAGSNSFKCVFLHENCGMLMIGSDVDNWPCYGVSHCLGIWTTVSYNTELPFHSQSEDINISKNLKFLEYMIYAVDNQKWPSQIDFDVSYYFEQDIHREIIAIDPKASILVGCDFNKYLSNLKQNISQDKRCGEENNLYTNYMPAE